MGGAGRRPILGPPWRAGQSYASTSEPTAPLSGSRAREVPGAAEKGAEPEAWPEGFWGWRPPGGLKREGRAGRGFSIF